MKLGAQMYTLRAFCKTPEGLAESLARVAEIGYRTVQLSGVCAYDPHWMKEVLAKNGLTAPVTHTAPDRLQNDLDAVIAEHDIVGIPYIGIGSAPGTHETPILTRFDNFMEWAPAAAAKIKAAGHKFLYHNHDKEFARNAEGKNFFQRLCDRFAPDELGIILDTYWVQAGGGNPVEFLYDLAGRTQCIHFKDMSYDPIDRKIHMAPVGGGNLNFTAIVKAAADTGVEYAFVEQDDCYGADPFACLKQSHDYCRALGITE